MRFGGGGGGGGGEGRGLSSDSLLGLKVSFSRIRWPAACAQRQ